MSTPFSPARLLHVCPVETPNSFPPQEMDFSYTPVPLKCLPLEGGECSVRGSCPVCCQVTRTSLGTPRVTCRHTDISWSRYSGFTHGVGSKGLARLEKRPRSHACRRSSAGTRLCPQSPRLAELSPRWLVSPQQAQPAPQGSRGLATDSSRQTFSRASDG